MTRAVPVDIQRLLDALEPQIRDAFLEAIAKIKSAAQLAVIAALIEVGDTEGVIRALRLDRSLFAPLDRAIEATFWAGGDLTISGLPAIKDPTGQRIAITFSGRHDRAESLIRAQAGNLIEGIIADQKIAVRAAIGAGLSSGSSASDVALAIIGRVNRATGRREGGILGLTSNQTDYLISARYELRSGDPAAMANYLTRVRRDARFDAIVKSAIAEGRKVSAADAEKMLARYSDRLLQLRGDTIAKNEAFSALSAGQHEGWRQLVDTGAVKASDITKRWQHNLNRNARPDHVEMSGKVVTLDEAFVMPDGTRMQHDHDPNGGAKNTINCHCTTFYRLRKGRA